jgi:hypothetical protein
MTRLLVFVLIAIAAASPASAQDAGRDGWVVLSIEEYRALRARAFPSLPDPAPPPVDAALTRVDYDLRVTAAGDAAAGQARLTIDVLKQGWVGVQMPAGLFVRDARIEGRPTALVEGNPSRVLISRPGRSTVTLEVVVPVTSQGGAESMSLPPSASALSSVTFTVPKTGVDLSVAGGFVAERRDAPNESRWIAYGSAGRALSFAWKRKADDRRGELPLRTRARVTQLVALGEDSNQLTANVQFEVTQGLAREGVIAIPAGVIVNHVTGATVADWNVDRGLLTVSFLEPISAQTSVILSGEWRAAREGSIAIPLVRVPAAERETGGVAVDVAGFGEIGDHQPRGLEPADPADLGDIVAGRETPSMVAFRLTPMAGGTARGLSVNLTRYEAKAVLIANIEEARFDALMTEDGKRLVRARYAVRNNQRGFLAVTLPANATLWSASLSGQTVRPGVSPSGGLLLPLRKGRANAEAPAFAVEILYLERVAAWPEKGDDRIVLPAVDLPISRTGLTLHYSPRFAIEPRRGAFRVDDDTGPWSAALRDPAASQSSAPPAPAPPPASPDREFKLLLDQLKEDSGRLRQGVIPVAVAFPAVGTSLFLASELTPESQPPAIDIHVRAIGGRR